MNKMESFKEADKKALLASTAQQIWASVYSGEAIDKPSLLNRFLLLTFADLKKYHYYYWFLFPALTGTGLTTVNESKRLDNIWSQEQVNGLNQSVDDATRDTELPFFIVHLEDGKPRVAPLSTYDNNPDTIFGFMDPGNTEGVPGWPLRNFLMLLNVKFGLKKAKVISFKYNRKDAAGSTTPLLLDLTLSDFSSFNLDNPPSAVGLEKNHQGKLIPKFLNLASTMDTKQLMENAVDLNLKLMRWRVLPSLDLERVASTKCLILGAGTLGCNLARALMSWGVRNLTFVDSGKVSFSNPVRQTLYTFQDAVDGNYKATAAAAACKAIFPSINATGHVMIIPMPGHPVQEKHEEEHKQILEKLTDLIKEHDVVFLGLDSREARWLPSLLCAVNKKITMNVALGFDTYVVMRHGVPENKLGCYFCNDVMAPRDSLTDRTLDQQCTVTRPGLSFLASSQAVELMVALLHHPDGVAAPAESRGEVGGKGSTELGVCPHQIRGFLTSFDAVLMTGVQYTCCVACSDPILEAYKADPWGFVLSVLNRPDTLEDVSGITKMKEGDADVDVEWDCEEFSDI
eukprot:TRINITY_DN6559_c0_g1_i1.p1 TRINITY_DN6559_c0_g1~~TRINITY_DN6559_c0_g1_i1.p1  ORF type:complete len:654 (-),score=162.07 TRINITY_DN6559_c0_g1_i1:34-1746(-)